MRALYAALLVTLVGLPVSAQKPVPQKPVVQQKAAPPAFKGDKARLMVFELRTQQYADRLVVAADKGESMATVDYLVRTISQTLHGGDLEVRALQAQTTGPAAADIAKIAQHHALANKAFQALRAELNVKDRNPKRATVMNLAYKLSDEAALAQSKTPAKHPIVKDEPVGAPDQKAKPKPDQPKG